MNLTDLVVVGVFVSGLYGLIVALSGRKHFLSTGVNPYRMAWVLSAISAISFGRGLLWWESHHQDTTTLDLLKLLVSEGATPARVKVAAVSIVLGLVLLSLVLWCLIKLPRDPSTFRRPQDQQRAFDYYVLKLKGGLDYAILADQNGNARVMAADEKQIQKRLAYYPNLTGPDGTAIGERNAKQQIVFWHETAKMLHQQMEVLDKIVGPARQGRNRRILFDVQYGGFYFVYLRLPDPRDTHAGCLYLFGATLNQEEINHKASDHHFDMLLAALRNIYRNIGVDQ